MRAHVIQGGMVVNTILIDKLADRPDLQLVDAAKGGAIGWAYDKKTKTFTPPAEQPAPPSAELAQLRAEALQRINDGYTGATRALSEGYPDTERESWPIQIGEANRLNADREAITPWIDAAAAARGINRVELAARITRMDRQYREIHGALTGTRQRLADAAWAVADGAVGAAEQLAAIVWPQEN